MNPNLSAPERSRLLPLVPLALAAVVFGGGLAGDFVWDDTALIRDNTLAHSLSHLGSALTDDFWQTSDPGTSARAGFYRPVVKVAFLLQYVAFGGGPVGFKVVSLALHLACVLLGYRWLLQRLPPDPAASEGTALAAAVGALLFAVHPSRAESVSWICGSTDLWMTLWLLLGLWAWDRWRKGPWGVLAGGAALCLATLSKEAAALAPLLLLVDALLLPQTPSARRRGVAGALGVGAMIAGALMARAALVPVRYSAIFSQGVLDLIERVLATWGLFLERVFFPSFPSVEVGALGLTAAGEPLYPARWMAIGAAGALLLLLAAVLAWRRVAARPYLADVAWFVLPLLPTLNVVPLKYKMLASERFLYWPLLGLCALLARVAAPALARPGRGRVAWLLGAAGVGLLFGGLSAWHVTHFDSDRGLWAYEHQRHPREPYAADMLARSLWDADAPGEALPVAAEALRLSSSDDERAKVAALWVYIRQDTVTDGELDELNNLRRFLDDLADADDPRLSLTVERRPLVFSPGEAARGSIRRGRSFATTRAILHARTLDLAGAEAQFRALTVAEPGRVAGWVNLARVLALQERLPEAEAVLAAAERELPLDPTLKRFARGVAAFASALAAASTEPARVLARGKGLLSLGAPRQALSALRPILEAPAVPPSVDAVEVAIEASLALGESDQAARILGDARARGPGEAPAWEALRRRLLPEAR